ncbi:MAG: tyrosine-type recombinase/integrase [Alphaproteobacteria bacterium]|nr:tyrosine-type recombinase/integrase [Alphaproteobacteria bacterium]
MPLTDIQCRNAKPREKPYKLFDAAGLYLEILPSGKKLWRLKYYFLKKEKRISFGAYPLVSLADAREKRDHAKRLLIENVDPSKARQNEKAEIGKKAENTFKAVALEWFDLNTERWSKGYAQKNRRILEMNLFPYIGGEPIADIKPPDLLECLRKVEKRGALDIATKTKQIAGMVFRYGIQTGKCEWNAAENLAGALRTRKTTHFAALDEKQLPLFLQALERNEARIFERTRRAVWLSLYTFQRPGEIRQAQWSEIDWEAKEWHISADKMKMRRDHIVPLSRQALEILKAQQEEVEHLNTDWVFPSQVKHKNPMSDGTVNKAIKLLGFGDMAVAHGFRALARTTIREKLRYDSEIIEKQLAHKTRNPLGEAYDRTQFLSERKKMMQDWASFVDTTASNGKVIHGNFKGARNSA